MFGSNDDQKRADDDVMSVTPPADLGASPAGISPQPSINNDMMNAATAGAPVMSASVTPTADLSTPELPSTGTPEPPALDTTSTPDFIETPVDDQPADDSQPSSPNDDLVSIKQQALQQLSPLVGQLDQSPEEKFRTTMMMIQASDDKSMIPDAFEAAKQITDDKSRAQALLDVINEINYFTQSQNNS